MALFLILPTMNVTALAQEFSQTSTGEWEFLAFGGNTSVERNPDPEIGDNSITMFASGGKIASGDEGISYYFKELPAELNFELRARAVVTSFNNNSSISTPNQKSFGLMVRDEVGEHRNSNNHTSNYAAVGALDTVMKGFYKNGTQTKLDTFFQNTVPVAGEEYELSIKKSGDTYVLASNGETETVSNNGLFTDTLFAGIYVARDAEVEFQDLEIIIDERQVSELKIDSSAMKKEYLVEEHLDLTGLSVTAVFSDGEEERLGPDDFIVTGFDSSTPGTNNITINFNGVTQTIGLTITALEITSLQINYFPAKTSYYIGDGFDSEGLEVAGEYNEGYKTETLKSEQFSLSILEENADDFIFMQAGHHTVTVTSLESPEVTSHFNVEVVDAAITSLEIKNLPEKTLYFIDDELELDGISVYANYDNNSAVRLMRNEYTVSELDTSSPGQKEITLTHKGQTASFDVEVKEREVTGVSVTSYPKTTYFTGEELDITGLEVAKIYDNNDQELLEEAQYTIDSSAFNHSEAGVYAVRIVPEDASLEPISFSVTVRENQDHAWKTIRFGQSTSDARNYLNIKEDGLVELVALEGGGKVTGDHDGITFYYTEIDAVEDNFRLSADIKVAAYAKNPHDGQESFGIMARDAIGTAGDSSVFASNIAAVGGYSGGTRNENGTQAFIRTGVESPDGAGSQGIQSIMLQNERPQESNTFPSADYRLTLAKTNSGYTASLNGGKEEVFYEPQILNVQDSKIYVGFYTARLAAIEVSNINFAVSAAETDAPRVDPPKEPVTPDYEILSLDKVSKTDYSLKLRSNVDGVAAVKQGLQVIEQDKEVTAGEILSIPATVGENMNTNFSVTFLPDDTEYLTSYDKVVKNFTVTMKTFGEDGDIYVSPDGVSSNSGTENAPIDLDTAIDFVKEGQKIIVLEGRYVRNSKIDIKKYNDGTEEARKYLSAAPGTRPVIDFDKRSEGVVLSGNYWHVEGLDFARSAGNMKGFTIGGSHNIVENSRFYEHGDTGLQISRTDGSNDKADWPSHNLILNSTSFDNRDPSDNNADGFAAKLTSGEGNIFRGCIAHNNIDDGWDLYTKAGTGAIGAVLIEDSIAYNNGFLTDGTVGAGDKNGFKLGGEGIHVPHVIKNSIAFGNGAYGFTSNSNPGVMAIDNIGFNNAGGNLSFTTYANIATDFTIDGFISYQKEYAARDNYPAELRSDKNYLFNGTVSENKAGIQLTDTRFKSLEPALPYERDEEGNIVWGDFLELIVASADISFTPKVLNTKSKGPKAFVEVVLEEGYSLEEIILETVLLNEEIAPVEGNIKDGKYVMIFSRPELAGKLQKGTSIPITITGTLSKGIPFKGSTHITVK
jgi:hypothetical protein